MSSSGPRDAESLRRMTLVSARAAAEVAQARVILVEWFAPSCGHRRRVSMPSVTWSISAAPEQDLTQVAMELAATRLVV
jgi:hypothetical protein